MPGLCANSDVQEGKARSFAIGTQSFIVACRNDQFYVYLNRCPHLGSTLEWHPDALLDDEEEMLRCATHGALFVVETGDCVAGPCVGDRLTEIAFTLRGDLIWIEQTC